MLKRSNIDQSFLSTIALRVGKIIVYNVITPGFKK